MGMSFQFNILTISAYYIAKFYYLYKVIEIKRL